jgi:hypothetical protein
MIFYLIKKYFIYSFIFFIGLSLFPYFLADDIEYLLPRALFWGGLFAGIYTHYEFSRKKIWPLYHNLGFNDFRLLVACFLSLQIFNLFLQFLM